MRSVYYPEQEEDFKSLNHHIRQNKVAYFPKVMIEYDRALWAQKLAAIKAVPADLYEKIIFASF